MKKTILFFVAFIATIMRVNAQIPNSGFENWTNAGAYMEPDGFLTSNSQTLSPPYPVTRSTDHYPASVGNYSIRIENNISLVPNGGFGIVLQNRSNQMFEGPGPAFPISGHPTSLTGYYKFTPQNGDTLRIQVMLFLNGLSVSSGEFLSTAQQSNWASFSVPLSNYSTADSASIMLAAYNSDGAPPQYVPYGNSVLFVDNLNFDNLITAGISDLEESALISIYPNPASDQLKFSFTENTGKELNLTISNMFGQELLSTNVKEITETKTLNLASFSEGIYFLQIKSDKQLFCNKKIQLVR